MFSPLVYLAAFSTLRSVPVYEINYIVAGVKLKFSTSLSYVREKQHGPEPAEILSYLIESWKKSRRLLRSARLRHTDLVT